MLSCSESAIVFQLWHSFAQAQSFTCASNHDLSLISRTPPWIPSAQHCCFCSLGRFMLHHCVRLLPAQVPFRSHRGLVPKLLHLWNVQQLEAIWGRAWWWLFALHGLLECFLFASSLLHGCAETWQVFLGRVQGFRRPGLPVRLHCFPPSTNLRQVQVLPSLFVFEIRGQD